MCFRSPSLPFSSGFFKRQEMEFLFISPLCVFITMWRRAKLYSIFFYNFFQLKSIIIFLTGLHFGIFCLLFTQQSFCLCKEEMSIKGRKKCFLRKNYFISDSKLSSDSSVYQRASPNESWSKSYLIHMLWQNGILISLLHTWANVYLSVGKDPGFKR